MSGYTSAVVAAVQYECGQQT